MTVEINIINEKLSAFNFLKISKTLNFLHLIFHWIKYEDGIGLYSITLFFKVKHHLKSLIILNANECGITTLQKKGAISVQTFALVTTPNTNLGYLLSS